MGECVPEPMCTSAHTILRFRYSSAGKDLDKVTVLGPIKERELLSTQMGNADLEGRMLHFPSMSQPTGPYCKSKDLENPLTLWDAGSSL